MLPLRPSLQQLQKQAKELLKDIPQLENLAAAQFTLERQYGTGHKILRNLARDCFRFSGAVGNERSHGAICDLRLESPAVASHPLRAICD